MKSATFLLVCALAAPATTQDKIDFAKQIRPIFEKNCYECHGDGEEEGDLRLDVRANVFAAREYPVLTPGDPGKSVLYQRISLPADDGDIMPPEDGPLPKAKIALIKQWITEGAHWPEDTGPVAPSKSKRKQPEPIVLPALDAAGKEREARAIKALEAKRVAAMRIARDTNALYVNLGLLGLKAGDADLDALRGLEGTLAWLHLGRTGVGDAGVAKLAEFRQLRRLHLERTKITDAALETVARLPELEYLNLYGTAITDAGLAKLAGLTKLRKLYVWQTKVTDAGSAKLKQALPSIEIDRGGYVATIRRVAAEVEARRPVNDKCPIKGTATSSSFVLVHDGERIAFCCNKCLEAFKKDPGKYASQLAKRRVRGPVFAKLEPVNTQCPITNKPASDAFIGVFEGKKIAFCCAKCLAAFKKNPKKCAAKLGLVAVKKTKK